MTKNIILYLLAPVLILTMSCGSYTHSLSSQDFREENDPFKFTGTLSDYDTGKRIDSAYILIYTDSNQVIRKNLSSNSVFELFFATGRSYRVFFNAPEHVSKNILIDFTGVTEGLGLYQSQLDLLLLRKLEGIDYSPCNQPISRISYDSVRKALLFDEANLSRGMEAHQAMKQAHEEKWKSLGN